MLLTNSRINTLIIEKATGLNANVSAGVDAWRNCPYYCVSTAVTIENDKNEIKLVGTVTMLLRSCRGRMLINPVMYIFSHSAFINVIQQYMTTINEGSVVKIAFMANCTVVIQYRQNISASINKLLTV